MKATRLEPDNVFVPVTLTLETQLEVDGLMAFLSHPISDSLGLHYQWKEIKPFVSPAWPGLMEKFSYTIKRS